MDEQVKNTNTPKVSVIIPVYNCAPYVQTCLDSVEDQTYKNLEIICVDDGSTDSSVAILERNAKEDERIRLIFQENAGPARARNVGMDNATGEYLYFLDADDFIDATLIEKAVTLAKDTSADIVMWDLWYYNTYYGQRLYPPEHIVNAEPFKNGKEVFSWEDSPDEIFLCFQTWPWNKLFRTRFVRDEGLRFQESIGRSEDVQFVFRALVKAERIAYIDERLINYRTARTDSAMSTKDESPRDIIEAASSLRDYLIAQNLYEPLKKSFLTWALASVTYNLYTMKTLKGFKELHKMLVEHGFDDIGAKDITPEDLIYEWLYYDMVALRDRTSEEIIFARLQNAESQRDHCEAMLQINPPMFDSPLTSDELLRLQSIAS
ncbi:MAG: glycosyltransferase [Eggerthellaceae bacterium]|nr:glycosyltransferase [Eggerthellaceae bacterium]